MRLPQRHLFRPSLSLPRSLRLSAAIGLTVLAAAVLAALAGFSAWAPPAGAASATKPGCGRANFPARRDRANPLMLTPAPTHGNVLKGANFFVPGPARGTAAGAIAQALGIDRGLQLGSGLPLRGFSDGESYTRFARRVARALRNQPAGIRHRVALLEKIAREPSPLRISNSSGGGSPSAVYTQTRKLFCQILRADPHTIPLVSTDFLHAELGGCATLAQMKADTPRFLAQIHAMARAIGRRRVVLFDEIDAVGSSSCMVREHSIGGWESLNATEASIFESLPHTAVYIEGGYSDSNSPAYTAALLRHMDIAGVQGFYTNSTHLAWTSKELRYAEGISRRLGGNVHFIINTAENGRGPLLNRHPRTQGIEALCNPGGRGLGIPDSTDTQDLDPDLDGLLWVVPPGNSSGSCNGGPTAGTFWPARAEQLAANANRQLGPGSPSEPY